MKNEVTRNFYDLMLEANALLDADEFNVDDYVLFAEKICKATGADICIVRANLKEIRNLEVSLRVSAEDGAEKLEHAAMCCKAAMLIAICDEFV